MEDAVVLNKLMYYNISHQTLTLCAFMDDDARACYDRIVTCMSSLECRKWGIDPKVAEFTNDFIESQKFRIRSAFGVSSDLYTPSQEHPTQGSGQGISWSGARWTCTSDSISRIMKKENAGMKFVDPTGEIDFFVDDTATGVSENCIHNGKTILEHLQRDEQRHSFLLFAAGHLLTLFKCIFYYYSLKLVGTKFVHTSNADLPGEMHLQSKYGGDFEKIKRLELNESHQTLGFFISVSMSQAKQYGVVHNMIKEWMDKIQTSPLSSDDRIYAYKTILEKNYCMYCQHAPSHTNNVPSLINSSAQHFSMFIKYNVTAIEMCSIHQRNLVD